MHDEIDAKLARIDARREARRKVIRAELSSIGALEVSDLCKEVFQATIPWIKGWTSEIGSNPFPEPGCRWTFYLKPKVKR